MEWESVRRHDIMCDPAKKFSKVWKKKKSSWELNLVHMEWTTRTLPTEPCHHHCHSPLFDDFINSVKPRLLADFYHRLIAHWLSTVFLRTFTHLYGKFTESVPDAHIRFDSKLVLLSLRRRQVGLNYLLLCKYKGEECIERLRAVSSGLYTA